MAYDFPASPTPGDEFTPPVGGQTYVWAPPRWLVKGVPPVGTGGGGGGDIPEAPIDNKQYARKNAAWDIVTATGAWVDITGKPATFPPTLPIAQSGVTNLVTDLAGKAPTSHTHTTAQVTGLDTALAAKEPSIATGNSAWFWAGDKTWKAVPAQDWSVITGKPATFAPSTHTHVIGDTTGLQTALDAKSPTSHTHVYSTLTGIPSTFAPSAHIHAQSEISGLITALAGKQNTLPAGGDSTNYLRGDMTWQAIAGGSSDWASITGKPSTFPPTVPIAQADITNLTTDLSARLLKAGDTMTGKLTLPGATNTQAMFNMPAGSGEPASPIDGDFWFSNITGVLRFRLGGVTKIIANLDTGQTWNSAQNFAARTTFMASTTASASIRLQHGVDPTAWSNGDMWTTTLGLYARINGATKGPFVDTLDIAGKANATHTHTQADITNLTTDLAARVAKAGDTMTGNLGLPTDGALTFGSTTAITQVSGPGRLNFTGAGSDYVFDANLIPLTDGVGSLGRSGSQWANLSLKSGAVITFGPNHMYLQHYWDGSTSTLTVAGNIVMSMASRTITIPGAPTLDAHAANKLYVDTQSKQYVESYTRRVMSGSINYYVNKTTGVDTNDGLSSGSPFKTITAALNKIGYVDISAAAIMINLADGEYTEGFNPTQIYSGTEQAPAMEYNHYSGMYGSISLIGNVTNPENVKVAIYTYDSTTLHATAILKGIGSLSGSSWNEIAVKGPCTLVLESCAFSSLKAFDNARLLVYGNSKLSGGTTLADVRSGASFYTTYNSKFNLLTPYTLTGDNAFLTVDSGATAYLDSITFSGSAVTGRRFRVRGNATVVAYNGNFTVLPGTVEGICETGGVYGGKYDYDKRMGSGGATIQETAPTFPAHGQLWWNSFNGNLYIWYIDSDGTAQWVQVNSGGA